MGRSPSCMCGEWDRPRTASAAARASSARRVGGSPISRLSQDPSVGRLDRLQHLIQPMHDPGDCEPVLSSAVVFEGLGGRDAFQLLGFGPSVAVNLDAQSLFGTVEVDDEAIVDRMLAAEVRAEAMGAQPGPQSPLRLGHLVPRFAGVPEQAGSYRLWLLAGTVPGHGGSPFRDRLPPLP